MRHKRERYFFPERAVAAAQLGWVIERFCCLRPLTKMTSKLVAQRIPLG